MKLLILIIGVFFATTAASQSIPDKLFGKWEAVGSDNQGIGLEIRDSSDIYLFYGKEKKKVGSFKADFSRSPAWFDFSVKSNSEVIQLKSILIFINDDLVQWQLFDSAERPEHFTETEGEMVYMRRMK